MENGFSSFPIHYLCENKSEKALFFACFSHFFFPLFIPPQDFLLEDDWKRFFSSSRCPQASVWIPFHHLYCSMISCVWDGSLKDFQIMLKWNSLKFPDLGIQLPAVVFALGQAVPINHLGPSYLDQTMDFHHLAFLINPCSISRSAVHPNSSISSSEISVLSIICVHCNLSQWTLMIEKN